MPTALNCGATNHVTHAPNLISWFLHRLNPTYQTLMENMNTDLRRRSLDPNGQAVYAPVVLTVRGGNIELFGDSAGMPPLHHLAVVTTSKKQ